MSYSVTCLINVQILTSHCKPNNVTLLYVISCLRKKDTGQPFLQEPDCMMMRC